MVMRLIFFVQTVLWRSQLVMLLNYSHCFVHQIFVSEGNLNNRNASLSDAMYIEFQQPHKTTSSKVITVESSPL